MPLSIPYLRLIVGGALLAGIAMIGLTIWSQRSTIADLRQSLANERAAHAVTRASVEVMTANIETQNAMIDLQRAATEQAHEDLRAAISASASSGSIIDRLISSSRAAPSGSACVPSEAVRSVWP